MGTYASSSDIASEFKSIDFSASNAVISTTEVNNFIDQEEAAIESEVATVYTVPVTGSKAIQLMKLMTIMMVKARILDILTVKSGKQTTDQGGSTSLDLRKRVFGGEGEDGMIQRIRKKDLRLVDAILAETTAGVTSYNVNNNITPIFKRDCAQW